MEHNMFFYIIVNLIGGLIIAETIGRNKRIGFERTFFLSLTTSFIIALICAALSTKKDQDPSQSYRKRKIVRQIGFVILFCGVMLIGKTIYDLNQIQPNFQSPNVYNQPISIDFKGAFFQIFSYIGFAYLGYYMCDFNSEELQQK
jgi:predicted permease